MKVRGEAGRKARSVPAFCDRSNAASDPRVAEIHWSWGKRELSNESHAGMSMALANAAMPAKVSFRTDFRVPGSTGSLCRSKRAGKIETGVLTHVVQ